MKCIRTILRSLSLLILVSSNLLSAKDPDANGFIHLTIWCEHPDWGQDYSTEIERADYDIYYSELIDFITSKNSFGKDNGYRINRLIMRVEDVNAKNGKEGGIYFIGQNSDNPLHGCFLKAIMKIEGKTNCEVYILPWLNENEDGAPWSYPLDVRDPLITKNNIPSLISEDDWDTLNNVQKSVLWVQFANEYMATLGSKARIKGIVYEKEDASPWEKEETAFPEFFKAMTKYLKAPSPKYSNNAASLFKFATASQFNFDQKGSNLYIHELVPQMYNLTSGPPKGTVDNPIKVDTTSAPAFLRGDYGVYTPLFPESIYTKSIKTDGTIDYDFLVSSFKVLYGSGSINKERLNDFNIMFSCELAKDKVCNIDNPFHTRDQTLTKAKKTGIINAFGVDGYDWKTFISFLKKYNDEYKTNHYAIFQYNMIPPSWKN